jgi:hypothetical protein
VIDTHLPSSFHISKFGDMGDAVQIVALVLLLLGLVLLAALLLTVNLSERVNRHPVFVNFLCAWVVWSAFMVFT